MFQGIVGIEIWYPRERGLNLAYDSERGRHGSQELDEGSAGGGQEGAEAFCTGRSGGR